MIDVAEFTESFKQTKDFQKISKSYYFHTLEYENSNLLSMSFITLKHKLSNITNTL